MPKTRSIRIPDDIDAALVAAAGQERESVQNRIVQALERDLAARGQLVNNEHERRVTSAIDRVHARRPSGYKEAMRVIEEVARRRGLGRRAS